MIIAVLGLSAIFPFGGPTIGFNMVLRGRCIGEDTVVLSAGRLSGGVARCQR